MKLSFRAKPGYLCQWPGMKAVGQSYAYVGRKFVPGDGDVAASHPVEDEPVEVDSESDEGRRFATFCRREELWPANAQTAGFCGREFVELEKRDGEWQPKAAKSAKGNS